MLARLILVLVFAALTIISTKIFLAEAKLQDDFWLGKSRYTLRPSLANPAGYSISSDQFVLMHCLEKMTSANFRISQNSTKPIIYHQCKDLSEQIIATARSNSFAWFILAFSENDLLASEHSITALTNSFEYAPRASWLAAIRVRFVAEELETLSTQIRSFYIRDIETLLLTLDGQEASAKIYQSNAAFRAILTGVLAAQPIQVQQNFIATLDRLVNG